MTKTWAAIGCAVVLALVALPALPALRREPPPTVAPEAERTEQPRVQGARQPNVVLIFTDDQRKATLSVMKATRRLFKSQGTTFDPAFASTPLCCPARATLFSGRYMHNHNVTTNTSGSNLDQDHTIQAYLQGAGYRTALFGKFLNTFPEQGIQHFDTWAMSRGFPYYNGNWNIDGTWQTVPTYSTQFIAEQAVRFITHAERADDTPWFLYLAPIAPHGPATPQHRYADAEVPGWDGNPRVFERDRSDKPRYIRQSDMTFEAARNARAKQLRTLLSVDDLVKRLFRKLKETGERRNTLAFFISDNGMHWAEHGWNHKTTPYRPSVEVPFLMRWPGHVAPGDRDGRFAAHVDVAPTILDAAGVSADPTVPMDGRSLLQQWRRKRVHLEYHHYKVFTTPTWASTRTRRGQYTELYNSDGRVMFKEFYRLGRDPWQLSNLLRDDNPKNDPDLRFLHRRLRRDRSCAGSSCP